MSNGNSERKKLVKVLTIIIILIIASVFGINISDIIPNTENKEEILETSNDSQELDGELFLHMIDVGQADSFLLIQNGKTALIDCGTRSTGKDVVEYLTNLGITKIDYVFGTHPHDDHMGGMYEVITNFQIGKVIIPDSTNSEITTNWYMKLIAELNSGKYETEFAEIGKTYELGDATMKIIGPMSEPEDNINNYSTVLKVTYGEMDIIMTGDAETEVEEEILESGEDIDAEILKVGHHGSDTSTSDEFLEAISPDYALISAKVGNKYKHPIKSTMDKLKNHQIKVYRTDENGTVIATITSDDVNFNCDPGDYLSGPELEERMEK